MPQSLWRKQHAQRRQPENKHKKACFALQGKTIPNYWERQQTNRGVRGGKLAMEEMQTEVGTQRYLENAHVNMLIYTCAKL